MKKNKKKRKFLLLLLALLLICLGAYGTQAYFTDSAQVNSEINLSIGNIKLKVDEEDWVYTPLHTGTSAENQKREVTAGPSLTATNLRPGDAFTKTFTIHNESSLDAVFDLKTAEGFLGEKNQGLYIISLKQIEKENEKKSGKEEGLENNSEILLEPHSHPQQYELKVVVNPEAENEFNTEHQDSFDLNIDGAIQASLRQPNDSLKGR